MDGLEVISVIEQTTHKLFCTITGQTQLIQWTVAHWKNNMFFWGDGQFRDFDTAYLCDLGYMLEKQFLDLFLLNIFICYFFQITHSINKTVAIRYSTIY